MLRFELLVLFANSDRLRGLHESARTLGELGYTRVRSLAGGYGAWKKAGLPIDKPFIFTDAQKARYARHTMLPEVGEKGPGTMKPGTGCGG